MCIWLVAVEEEKTLIKNLLLKKVNYFKELVHDYNQQFLWNKAWSHECYNNKYILFILDYTVFVMLLLIANI